MRGKAASTHCYKMFGIEKPKAITKGSFVFRTGQTIQLHLHKLGEFFWVMFLHSRNATCIWVNTASLLTIIKLSYTIINFNALPMQTLLFLPTRIINKTFPWKLPLSLWGFVFNYSSARAYCSSPTELDLDFSTMQFALIIWQIPISPLTLIMRAREVFTSITSTNQSSEQFFLLKEKRIDLITYPTKLLRTLEPLPCVQPRWVTADCTCLGSAGPGNCCKDHRLGGQRLDHVQVLGSVISKSSRFHKIISEPNLEKSVLFHHTIMSAA